jgi:hypothetical protein
MRMALTVAPLPAFGARPVNYHAVGAHLEAVADVGKTAQIQRASLELRDVPTSLALEVVVMVKHYFICSIARELGSVYWGLISEDGANS